MLTVIHPKDDTTTFLEPIYNPIVDKIVVRNNTTYNNIKELLSRSDRVLMMGHGSSYGLFSVELFNSNVFHRIFFMELKDLKDLQELRNNPLYVISHENVELLQNKPQNVYIWCNADKFVEKHELQGFYSGMFISEVRESLSCGFDGITPEVIDESNNTFSSIVGQYIHLPVPYLYEKVMEEYGNLARTNPIAQYNYERLYFR